MAKENYVFAGRVLLSSDKLGYKMYKLEGLEVKESTIFWSDSDIKTKTISWSSRKDPRLWIGEIVEVDYNEEKKTFSHNGTNKKIDNENLIEIFRIESINSEEKYQQEIDRKKAQKEAASIEGKTIGELKEFCKKHPTYRFTLKEYLERYFFK